MAVLNLIIIVYSVVFLAFLAGVAWAVSNDARNEIACGKIRQLRHMASGRADRMES